MAIPTANAYDTNTEKWIGRVPVTWFDLFENLKHEGPDGERPDEPHVPLGDLKLKELRDYAAEHGVDLKGAKSKADVQAAIVAAESVPGDPAQDPPGDDDADDPGQPGADE